MNDAVVVLALAWPGAFLAVVVVVVQLMLMVALAVLALVVAAVALMEWVTDEKDQLIRRRRRDWSAGSGPRLIASFSVISRQLQIAVSQ